MNKKDIITAYAKMYNISKRQSGEEIERFIHFINESLLDGEELYFKGFAKFGIKHMPSRNVKLPNQDELIKAPSYTKPTFRYSEILKENISKAFNK